jgi:hypothetical protein
MESQKHYKIISKSMKDLIKDLCERNRIMEALDCYDTEGCLCPEDAIQDRLVPAVEGLMTQTAEAVLSAVREIVEGMKKKEVEVNHTFPTTITTPFGGVKKGQKTKYIQSLEDEEIVYNQALDDLLTQLQTNQD